MVIHRYLLFCGRQYDSSGGWLDFDGAFDSADEAAAVGACGGRDQSCARYGWWHVVDVVEGVVVKQGENE